MKTVVINADDSSAKIFLELARKLKFKALILNEEAKEDAVLLSIMQQRKHEELTPVSKTYEILRKAK